MREQYEGQYYYFDSKEYRFVHLLFAPCLKSEDFTVVFYSVSRNKVIVWTNIPLEESSLFISTVQSLTWRYMELYEKYGWSKFSETYAEHLSIVMDAMLEFVDDIKEL